MTFVIAALLLLLVGAGALTAGLMLRRRARADMENRLKLVAEVKRTQNSASDPFKGLLKAQTKEIDRQIRRMFTVGIKRTWGMRTGTLTLLLMAAVSAIATWILAHVLSSVATLVAAALSLAAAFSYHNSSSPESRSGRSGNLRTYFLKRSTQLLAWSEQAFR